MLHRTVHRIANFLGLQQYFSDIVRSVVVEQNQKILSDLKSLSHSLERIQGHQQVADRHHQVTHRHQRELLYLEFFRDFCTRQKISKSFYSVGGSANATMLYLLARIIDEQSVHQVLELGAGISTKLLSELQSSRSFEYLTLEEDPQWREQVAEYAGERVSLVPLYSEQLFGVDCLKYDLSVLPEGVSYDFVIVDGPKGQDRYSRISALDIVENFLSEEFILLFDDAERTGEQDTIALCREKLTEKEIEYFTHDIHGVKSQHLLMTQKYQSLLYY